MLHENTVRVGYRGWWHLVPRAETGITLPAWLAADHTMGR
jgi:hypothetical protein